MMKTFSIAELEQYSLIKAHTFRTWEKRFGIGKTNRTATNIRCYTLRELAFLLDLSLLNRFGYKVSSLAMLGKEAVSQSVFLLKNDRGKQEHQINQLIIAMLGLDIEDFELILDHAFPCWGIDVTIENIILPFLERLHLFSNKGHTSNAYYFVITILHKKIILAIEQANPKILLTSSALLFLPKGEYYDLLLLYLQYKLRKAGLNTLYLGTDVATYN
jgi:MerR family transcriptional regulator, light-induced transcriptional regulator